MMKNNRQGNDQKIMRAVFTLALVGAFTLPLQGCNEDVPVPESFDAPVADEPVVDTTRVPVEDLPAVTKTSVIRGARLYDNWITEAGKTAPTDEIPIAKFIKGYSATSPVAPYSDFAALEKSKQYRCKTCHGYEYVGVEFYGGSLMGAADNATLEQIQASIKDGGTLSFGELKDVPVHNFGADAVPLASRLSAADIADLANFIKYGVLNVEEYFFSFSPIGLGDSKKGQELFGANQAGCATSACHGDLGKNIDFADGNLVTVPNEFVGTIGQDDPAEMLHKVRFGNAGTTPMPGIYKDATLGFTTQDAVDIMTYTQQLPRL